MATNKNRKGESSRRPAPLVAKAGVTRDGKRKYGCGGKMHAKGGKLCK